MTYIQSLFLLTSEREVLEGKDVKEDKMLKLCWQNKLSDWQVTRTSRDGLGGGCVCVCVWPVKRAFRHALYQLTKSNFPPNFSSHRDAVGSRFFRFRLTQFGSYFPNHFSILRSIVSLLFRVNPQNKNERQHSEDWKRALLLKIYLSLKWSILLSKIVYVKI